MYVHINENIYEHVYEYMYVYLICGVEQSEQRQIVRAALEEIVEQGPEKHLLQDLAAADIDISILDVRRIIGPRGSRVAEMEEVSLSFLVYLCISMSDSFSLTSLFLSPFVSVFLSLICVSLSLFLFLFLFSNSLFFLTLLFLSRFSVSLSSFLLSSFSSSPLSLCFRLSFSPSLSLFLLSLFLSFLSLSLLCLSLLSLSLLSLSLLSLFLLFLFLLFLFLLFLSPPWCRD